MRNIAERNELAVRNKGLVGYCVKEMNFGNIDDDLFQIGYLGLMRAAELYDETRGAKFSTYAVKCIKGTLMREISKNRKIQDNEISGDTPIGKGDITVFDSVCDDNDFTEDLIDKIAVEQIISTLPQRKKQIIQLTKKGRTQREIAETLNTSRENVARIFNKIIKVFQDETVRKKYALEKLHEYKRQKGYCEKKREKRNNYMREYRKRKKAAMP